MSAAAQEICKHVVVNNDAIRNGTSAGVTTIINISSMVRRATEVPNPNAQRELFELSKKTIEGYMEAHFGKPLRDAKANGRVLFNSAAEMNRSLGSIERAVRFSFLSLDNAFSKKNGVLLLSDVPYASLRDTFVDIQPSLYESLIARMNEMRDGDALSRDAIKSVVDLIRKINHQIDKTTRSLTAEIAFTAAYCTSVQTYYLTRGGEKLSASENVVAYAKWAGNRINEERALLGELNMSKEWDKLKESLHKSLVRDGFIEVVHDPNGGLAKELDEEHDVSDLFALLELVSKPEDPLEGVKEVGKSYEAYAERRAEAILTAPAPPPEPAVPNGPKKPPVDKDVVNFKEFMRFMTHHLLSVWPVQFKKNPTVLQYFENGIRKVLKNKDKAPRLHSEFIHDVLRVQKDDDLNDEIVGQIFVFKKVFECISQKDEFLPNYKSRLSRRIIRSTFRRATETRMLLELKSIVGNADIHSMSSMITDVDGSATLSKTFAETSGKEHKTKANFILMTRQYWPTMDLSSLTYPPVLQIVISDFEKYYSGRYHNRKIDWILNLSCGTVQASFTAGPKELTGSIIQALILLNIDGTKGLTAGAIANILGLASGIVCDNLASLSLSRVNVAKIVDPETFAPSPLKVIKAETPAFAINDGFKSTQRKMDLQPAISSRNNKVVEADTAVIESNRRLRAQIAVIRFMKSRGTSMYPDMVEAVLRDLRTTFDAQPALIKTTLDDLIEKDYVKRDEKERAKLIYIA